MYIDTHCHLNFKRFKKNVEEVIEESKQAGVEIMVVPGTDISTSKRAIEIASKNEGVYSAVGIHPHHVYECMQPEAQSIDSLLEGLDMLIQTENVVAVGEVGMDRHVYKQTKYESYAVNPTFLSLQENLFRTQIQLAIRYKKSLIVHNREASGDLIRVLQEEWDASLEHHTVFHCCEANPQLLQFAQDHNIFIGIDGDVTYDRKKRDFIQQVPLKLLVLETDSPFILPEPLKSQKKYPNSPANIPLIAKAVAEIKNVSIEEAASPTTINAKKLFQL